MSRSAFDVKPAVLSELADEIEAVCLTPTNPNDAFQKPMGAIVAMLRNMEAVLREADGYYDGDTGPIEFAQVIVDRAPEIVAATETIRLAAAFFKERLAEAKTLEKKRRATPSYSGTELIRTAEQIIRTSA